MARRLTRLTCYSLQFDPAPRAGEPLVSRRVPDYFLVSGHIARRRRRLVFAQDLDGTYREDQCSDGLFSTHCSDRLPLDRKSVV